MQSRRYLIPTSLLVAAVASIGAAGRADAVTREYFIAAEEVVWDFAPSGQNLIHGGAIPRPYRTTWKKTRSVEYTDASFSTQKPQPRWLGVLGPIIRAEVGDHITVRFMNRARRPYGIHPHGVLYDKDNEKAHYLPHGAGAEIPPAAASRTSGTPTRAAARGRPTPTTRERGCSIATSPTTSRPA